MQQAAGRPDPDRELAQLRARRDALHQSAARPGARAGELLADALAELDAAIGTVEKLRPGDSGPLPAAETDAERRLLQDMFQNAPVPLFLLERGGVIRRTNLRAGQLLGAQPGYATGRLLTAFVDPPARAAVAAQLAVAARTGRQRHVQCGLLGASGPFDAVLTIAAMTVGDQRLLVVAVGRDVLGAGPGAGRGAAAPRLADDAPALGGTIGGPVVPPGAGPAEAVLAEAVLAGAVLDTDAARVVAAMSQRLDLVTAATRLFLDNATFSEAVTLRRCARLLAGELAAWVIVDVERRQRLRRQVVIGPAEREYAGLARRVAAVHPRRASLPRQVHESGRAALLAREPDVTVLGTGKDGVPLLTLLGGTSLLSVPLSDGERNYGVLTLVRGSGEQPFEIADLALVEELGAQLGLAIRVDRMFRRRSEIADSLQASLLPNELPALPGLEFAAAYVAATDPEGIEVGGDFYDAYRSPGGWGIAIGDVCGKGEEAAAVTAAARHAIRVLAHWNPDPADVLSRANEVLLSEAFESRFVTACAGYLQRHGDRLRIKVASAGHPGQLILRAGGTVQSLRGGGMPLGIFPAAEIGTEDVELGAGDALVMFTDGVTEARNPDLEYFEDRLPVELARLAGQTATEIVAAVQALVLEFSQNELRDDVTMLVLRVS
jgi:serine phosphatase RsbU (regulator of sigma subunit)/PAS domain-containing protein